jgi:hypothetical protein
MAMPRGQKASDSYTSFGFSPWSGKDSTSPPLNSMFSTSRECCLDSSEVLGLLRLALWPPTMLLGLKKKLMDGQ